MKYYLYRPDANNFAGIGVAFDDDNPVSPIHYADVPLTSAWTPLLAHGFDDNPEEEGDFPSMNNFWRVPVMSQRAWDTLRSLVGYCCEALPIIHPTGQPFFLIHVMETIDCLDWERSKFTVNEVPPRRISRVFRYAFKPGMLDGKHIFKLPLESGADLIVDDIFRHAVEANGLRGLEFTELPVVPSSPDELAEYHREADKRSILAPAQRALRRHQVDVYDPYAPPWAACFDWFYFDWAANDIQEQSQQARESGIPACSHNDVKAVALRVEKAVRGVEEWIVASRKVREELRVIAHDEKMVALSAPAVKRSEKGRALYPYFPDADHFDAIGVEDEYRESLIDLHFRDLPSSPMPDPVLVHGFGDNPGNAGDFPSMSTFGEVPVMSQRAWDALRPLIGYCCEALLISHPSGKPHFLIHVMETIDCLDEEASQLRVSDIDFRVNRIHRYAFKPGMLDGKHIFKLPLESGADLIVDDEFRKVVEANGLKGLLFKELPTV